MIFSGSSSGWSIAGSAGSSGAELDSSPFPQMVGLFLQGSSEVSCGLGIFCSTGVIMVAVLRTTGVRKVSEGVGTGVGETEAYFS